MSPKLTRRGWLLCASILVWVAAACGCVRASTNDPQSTPTTVPGVNLDSDDDIKGLDVEADPLGQLHLTWLQIHMRSGFSEWEYSTWYCRSDVRHASWTHPVKIMGGDTEPPRLLIAGRRLHILSGRNLRHFVSTDNGTSWKELPPLIPNDDSVRCHAFKYDAVILDSAVVVAYLGYSPDVPRGGGQPESFDVRVIRRVGLKTSASHVLGRFPEGMDSQALPRLIVRQTGLVLVVTMNGDQEWNVTQPSSSITTMSRDHGGLVQFRSTDGGLVWSAPKPMPNRAENGREWRHIMEVHYVHEGNKCFVLFNSLGRLHSIALNDTGWNSAVHLLEGPQVALVRSSDSRTFDCIGGAGGTRLVWASEVEAPQQSPFGAKSRHIPTRMNAAQLRIQGDSLHLEPDRQFGFSGRSIRALKAIRANGTPTVVWASTGLRVSQGGRLLNGVGIAYRALTVN